MVATVVFDLTVAILLGVVYSAILYMAKSSHIHINFSEHRHEQAALGGG